MIPLILLGVLGIAYVLTRTASAATSPQLFVASSSTPVVTPLPSGLPTGWYWEDQGNQQPIAVGQGVKAIAMSPDDVAMAIYGTVFASGANVSFHSYASPGMFSPPGVPISGAMTALPDWTITLPLSYVEVSA